MALSGAITPSDRESDAFFVVPKWLGNAFCAILKLSLGVKIKQNFFCFSNQTENY